MPRLTESQIPLEVRTPGVLRKQLEGLGFIPSPASVELFTRDGGDVFVVARMNEESGNLEVSQVTYPSALNEDLGDVLQTPFSSSTRMPGEEGV